MINWWWLSFVDEARPEGQRFSGAVLVPGLDIITAARIAHVLQINPGGQVAGMAVADHPPVPDKYRLRLLTKEECIELDNIMTRLQDAEENS